MLRKQWDIDICPNNRTVYLYATGTSPVQVFTSGIRQKKVNEQLGALTPVQGI